MLQWSRAKSGNPASVNIIKVYIERNNLQVELMRYHKSVDFIHVYFCVAPDSMEYRPPDAYTRMFRTQTTSDSFLTV